MSDYRVNQESASRFRKNTDGKDCSYDGTCESPIRQAHAEEIAKTMRAKIAKAVREVFASKLRHEIPQFVLVETRRTRPGDCLFSWRMNPDANAYIYLFISPKYNQDRFSVELACSAGEFPMQMPRQPNCCEQNGPIRFRLPQLYKDQWPKKNWEPMWEVGPHDTPREAISRVVVPRHVVGKIQKRLLPMEQAIELVEPQVQDAIDKIRRFGIPFFQKIGGHNSEKLEAPDKSRNRQGSY